MIDFLLQILAAAMLAGVMWLAYSRWIKPHRDSLDFQQWGAMLLIMLTLAGGLLGSPFWWFDQAQSFSWDLPPLASRMLAGAGLSFFVVCALALQRPNFRRVRLVMLLLFVYLAPLAAVIFLFHMDRFDPSKTITYAFFAIAIAMTVSSAWYLFRPPRPVITDEPRDVEASSLPLKAWLGAVGVLTAVWGLALFITDMGPSELIWVWPGDLLTSRLIGVMLLTIAAGVAYSLRFADLARTMLAMVITYAIGLAVSSFWLLLAGKPIKLAYTVVFGLIFLGSAVLLLWERTAQLSTQRSS